MDDSFFQFGLKALATLFVVVDPLGVAPIFVALTAGMEVLERRKTLARALLIAFGVTLFFLIAGHVLLSYLGITVFAFSISGGILLFIAALPMLFGHRPGLQSPERDEQGSIGEDIAIFPLAIPLLSGPGTITTILLLGNQAGANFKLIGTLALVSSAVYLISWCILYGSEQLISWLGEGKVRIITRVLGIVLAALAVQYVLNGIGGYYQSLIQRP